MRWYVMVAVLIVLSAGSVCEATLTQSTLRTGALTEAGEIVLRVRDNLSGVDPLSIRLIIDGREVKPSLAKIAQGYSVSYTPTGSSNGEYNVELFASDRARNSMRRAYRFIGAPSAMALGNPKPCPERLLLDGPMLRRAARGELNVASGPVGGCEPKPVSMAPQADEAARDCLVTPPGLILPRAQPPALFDVAIAKELHVADQRELYEVTFDVRANHAVNAQYELFVGLIDPYGEVVFYEPEAGRRALAFEELEQTGDSGFRLKLSFEPGDLAGVNYTWCAVVAPSGHPEHIVSNVASVPFDVSLPLSEMPVLDGQSSFP